MRAMVEHVSRTYGLSPEDAYLLASLCVDLRISEIVDAGQYIVSALLPEMVFAGGVIDLDRAHGGERLAPCTAPRRTSSSARAC